MVLLCLATDPDEYSYIRKVSKDCHITFENNYYSAPSKYVGMNVRVSVSTKLLKIYVNDFLVATHPRSRQKGIFSTVLSHYDKYKTPVSRFF